MKRFSFFIMILFLVSSCTLNSEQELKLNLDVEKFIQLRNAGDALAVVNYTEPSIVKYYLNQGDSVFIAKFQELPSDINLHSKETIYWDKGYIKRVKSKKDAYQVRIEIILVKNHKKLKNKVIYYAISTKDSPQWLFISEEDYFSIYPEIKRLF